MGRQKIVVVTDSSAYIPYEALGGLDIPVIPLWVIWEDERFRDGLDIDPPIFYRRLRTDEVLPTTSQPSVGEFAEFFRQAAAGADGVVGIFVTSRLSGTVANALATQAELPELNIRIIDSQSTSMGMGFMVLAAARAAAEGKSLDEVVAAAKEMRDRVHFFFALDTLEYLHKGGRISGARWLLGTALSIKPVLHFVDGILEPLVQVRTKRKALDKIVALVECRAGGKQMAEVAVVDVDAPEEGDDIAARLRQRFGISTVYRTTVSPAIGTHAGPGTVGVAFYTED